MSAPETGASELAGEALLLALRWSLRSSPVSNSGLAVLSNVCPSWRAECVKAAVEAAREDAAAEDAATEPGGDGDGVDGGEPRSPLDGLLIVDMVRETLRTSKNNSDGATDAEGLGCTGSFCLAWFGPEGLRTTKLRGPFKEDGMEVVEEWRGRRHPHEVLGPFGYAEEFVRVSAGFCFASASLFILPWEMLAQMFLRELFLFCCWLPGTILTHDDDSKTTDRNIRFPERVRVRARGATS